MSYSNQKFDVHDATLRAFNWRNLRRLDWILILFMLILVVVGWATMYSASRSTDIGYFNKQVLIFFVGAALALFIACIDYRFLVSLAPLMYVVGIMLLLGVIFFGTRVKGSERWLALGPVRIQPSEFLKIIMVYALTWYLVLLGARIRKLPWFILTFIITGIPMLLILKQPNLGTAASLIPLVFAMLFVAGCRIWHLALIVLAGLSVVPVVWLQIKDFDPALDVSDADVRGDKDGAATYDEFGMRFGIRDVPKTVSDGFTDKDVVNLVGKSKCKLVLLGIQPDGRRVFQSVPNTESEWIPARDQLLKEGCSTAGLFYDPEFFGMSLLDRNRDGLVDESEFMSMDKNGDGKISEEDKSPFDLYHHQKKRIYTFLHPEEDVSDSGWQTFQSQITVGSGGLKGKGFLQGTQTRLNYLPEHHTDFIYSLLAEEHGFFGSVIVIGLFAVFLLRGLMCARDCPDMMGTLLATGVVTILAFHVFVNIAITVGLMPVTGIPLPFLSYGRSFYMATMAGVGILLNVQMRRGVFVD